MRLTAAGQRLNCTAFPFNHQNGTSWQTIIDIFSNASAKVLLFFDICKKKLNILYKKTSRDEPGRLRDPNWSHLS